ncbi:MAG: FAD-binding protein [Trueperella sp.]|nr:FAD-binding protein [Trueperella sp.]
MSNYIVVGAGSAGNVIARRLLDAGHTVTIVEAGGYDTNPIIPNVWEAGALWGGPEDWAYKTTEQPGCNNRQLNLPRGKVMGGSHALNATIWVRGHRRDFDTWEYLGCPGWGWDDVEPVYDSIENYDGGGEGRGTEGVLDIVGNFDMNPVQEAILEAGQQWGLAKNEDYNSGELDGISKMQLTIRENKRLSTWGAYLKPVKDHDNLTILTEARVQKLILDGTTVTGVLVEVGGDMVELVADEVILAGGAFGSPEILLRSGIGPAEELKETGVDVVVDLPGVGKNLHDHLLSPVIFSTEKTVPVSTVGAAETHWFWKSTPDLAVPDTQPINFSLPMYFTEDLSGPDNGFSLVAGIVRPVSRGEIRLTGPSINDPISVDLGALEDQSDVDSLVASVRQCREVGRQAALAEWGATEVHPGPDVDDTDEALEAYVRSTAVTYHHQVGTCKMGIDDMAVVDPRTLKVYGLDGVRVADASIMPLVITGNTNAPSVMIGERAATMILN